MRRHLTYANIAATLALVFAMTGGAIAAKHYLINSTSQINPKVLKKLHGAKGATGEKGANGAPGAPGKQGVEGKQGNEGKQGPPNQAFSSHILAAEFNGLEGAPLGFDELSLPAGSYTLLATLAVENTGAAAIEVECGFEFGGTALDKTPIAVGAKDSRSLALSGVATLATATTLELVCKAPTKTGAYINPTLTATRATVTG
jgi:hypothetical protein